AAPGWTDIGRASMSPRLSPYPEVTSELGGLGVFGRSSRFVIARVLDVDDKDVAAPPRYGHISRPFADASVIIARVPEIDLEGFEIFVPATAIDTLRAAVPSAGSAEVS